jgi:non-specific protein-tyrosine kinase
MGKFSEALKKAGKEERLGPLEQPQKRLPPDDTKVVPKPKHTKSPNRPEWKVSADETEATGASAAAPVEKPVVVEAPMPDRHPAPVPSMPDGDADRNIQDPPDVAVPTDQSSPVRKQDAARDIVVKPYAPDEPASPVISTRASSPSVSSQADKKSVQAASGRNIQVSYSRTRVQAFDPEKLKNNKIFSIFDDIETTDQVKILRTQVLKKLKDIGGNSILVTSAKPYEGKTFTSINLGVSIAKEFSRTVLIIDADLRKPTKRHTAFSTEFFTLDVELGLTDYLKGEADIPDILINPGIDKLTLIPGGRPVDNAPELLSSNRMAGMMAEIKSRYASDRLVIVDGPAMLPFPDALILSRYVDGVLPVVELERTPVDQLKKMMDSLKDTRIIGTVMNKNRG